MTAERADARLKFWQGLTEYAVSQRGKGAQCEYELVPIAATTPEVVTCP